MYILYIYSTVLVFFLENLQKQRKSIAHVMCITLDSIKQILDSHIFRNKMVAHYRVILNTLFSQQFPGNLAFKLQALFPTVSLPSKEERLNVIKKRIFAES